MKIKKLLIAMLQGAVVGVANVIPGVSGGTLMVSMGIYDSILCALSALIRRFRESVKVLWPYAVGMVAGILLFARLITLLLERWPVQTCMVFIGLIGGGIPLLIRKTRSGGARLAKGCAFAVGIAVILALRLLNGQQGADAVLTGSFAQMPILLSLGAVAAAAMMIPGVSGSMVLMLLGYYEPVIGSVSRLMDALARSDLSILLESAAILCPLGVGILAGIFAVSKLFEWLLRRYAGTTYCAILGLVIGSMFALLLDLDFGSCSPLANAAGVLLFAVAFGAAYLLSARD